MKLKTLKLVTLVAASFFALTAQAELSEKQVERWVASLEPVQEWIEKNQDKVNKQNLMKPGKDGMSGMFDNALNELKNAGLLEDFNGLVKEQGYASSEAWADDSGEITLAYLASSMEGKIPSRASIEQQLPQVDGSPLPAASKEMMRNMLQGTLSMIKDVEAVPAGDKKLIQPYVQKIEQRFGHAHQ